MEVVMKDRRRVARILAIAGVVAAVGGALDPLEGSVVIVVGCALLAAAAWAGGSRHRALVYWSFVLVAAGVAMLFALSAVGGFGGTSGRSMAWGLTLLPYPIGWIAALIGAARLLREPLTSVRSA